MAPPHLTAAWAQPAAAPSTPSWMKLRLEMVSMLMQCCLFPMAGIWGGWGKEEFEEEIAAA